MIYERALEERTRLENEIDRLKNELTSFPEGKLIHSSDSKHTKFYVRNGDTRRYLSTKERSLTEALAAKKYVSAKIDDYSHELMAINHYLNHHEKHTSHADDLLSKSSKYHQLLTPYFSPLADDLCQWMHADYDKKTDYPEQLLHTGLSGNRLRSKSESYIDIILTQYNIPFRYECKLELGRTVYYPDFTIRHPSTGAFYYWEHFGMMDRPEYRNSVIAKLQTYIRHGIIPSINLITTYENQVHPLQPDYVKTLVEYHFL